MALPTWTVEERRQVIPEGYQPQLPDGDVLRTLMMERGQIEHMLERVDLRLLFPQLPGKAIKVPCLWHRDTRNPSMGVFRNNVYCYTCQRSASAVEAVRLLCGTTQNQQKTFAIIRAILSDTLVQREEPVANEDPLDTAEQTQYLKNLDGSRADRRGYWERRYGMPIPVQKEMGLGHTLDKPHAFTFPLYDVRGRLWSIRYRRDEELWPYKDTVIGTGEKQIILPDKLRYWSTDKRGMTVWYFPRGLVGDTVAEALTNRWGSSVVVWCEQEISAALLALKWGIPAIATTNGAKGWTHDKSKAHPSDLAGCSVIVAFDADEAGISGGAAAVEALRALDIQARQVVLPELPGRTGTDFGDLSAAGWTRREVRALLTRKEEN